MSILGYAVIMILFAAGSGIAAMTGIGGGVLYTPIQVMAGIDIHEAAATSLLIIMLMSLSASVTYRRAGKIDWVLAAFLETFTVAGGFAGGYLSGMIPGRSLMIVLAVTLCVLGIVLIRHEPVVRASGDGDHRWFILHRSFRGACYAVNMLAAAPLSVMAGMLSGLIGIGGGVIHVPMMILFFGIPTDIAVATSAFMVGITAAGGFAGHAVMGHGNWTMGIIAAPAVIAGAQIGARIMLKTRKELIQTIFGMILLLTAAAVLVKLAAYTIPRSFIFP